MADNSLRYRTSPVLSRSRSSGAGDALGSDYAPASQSAGSGHEDPLAELARLVGEADPFPAESYATSRQPGDRDFGAATSARASWDTNYQAESYQTEQHAYAEHLDAPALGDDGYAQGAYDDQGAAARGYAADGQANDWEAIVEEEAYREQSAEEETYYADDQHAADQAYADDQHYAAYDDDQRYDDAGVYPARAPIANKPRARRGRMVAITAILAFAVLGTGGAYAFRTVFAGGAPKTPPIIKADTSPTKMAAAPTDANSNKQLLDRIADRGQNERMVPREEQPMDLKPGGAPQIAGNWPATQGAPAAAKPHSMTDPRPVKTVTIGPGAGSAAPAPANGAAPARAPTTIDQALASRAPAPETPRTASANPNYVLQLSASNTREEAQAALRSAQSKYSDLLNGRHAQVKEKKSQSPEKPTLYAAQVGGFSSREEAAQVCRQLVSAGGKCYVP
jgi:hypothetical protein